MAQFLIKEGTVPSIRVAVVGAFFHADLNGAQFGRSDIMEFVSIYPWNSQFMPKGFFIFVNGLHNLQHWKLLKCDTFNLNEAGA